MTFPEGRSSVEFYFDLPAPIVAVQWHPERLAPGHPARERLAELLRKLQGD